MTVVAALSATRAFAVTSGAEIASVGAAVHVPPVSVTVLTIPFSTVALAVGNTLHFPVPVTLILGAATYPEPPAVTFAVVPFQFETAVAVVRVVVRYPATLVVLPTGLFVFVLLLPPVLVF